MKFFIGLLLVLAGIALGLYVGVWWAFIGGIVKIITQVRAEHLNATELAFGIARTLFAGAIGWLSGLILIVPGVGLMQSR